MYLSEFNIDQQKCFLNLAYTLMCADGKLTKAEKEVFQSYKMEVKADPSDAKKVAVQAELAKVADLSDEQKRKFYFELVGLALADMEYADNEMSFMKEVQTAFGIGDETAEQLEEFVTKISRIYAKLDYAIRKG